MLFRSIYCKDLGLIHESGRKLRLTIPMTAAALDLYRKTAAAGMGELDCVAVIQTLEHMAGPPPGQSSRRAGRAGPAAKAGSRKKPGRARPAGKARRR